MTRKLLNLIMLSFAFVVVGISTPGCSCGSKESVYQPDNKQKPEPEKPKPKPEPEKPKLEPEKPEPESQS